MVTDEGVGFDMETVPGDRLGVRAAIRGRIESVGGTVQMWSSPGSGTSLVMTVPVAAIVREHEAPQHQEQE
jgi:signal transduction histidine kinase